jgi:hypothetical protein
MKYQLEDGANTDIENQKYLANASTQARTNLEDDTQQYETTISPRQLEIKPSEHQKRLLINRNQLRSDSPFIID